MRSDPAAFTLFRPESPLRNAAGIFILTTLFYFIGAELRLVEALSLFWPLFADWFSEQFSTGVLILPCMLTVSMPTRAFKLRLEQLLPVIALIVSVMASVVIGGAGSLAFPLPALIWCAVRYSLPATCLLTFLTGGLEIVLVANSIINIAVGTPLSTPMMFSARLGLPPWRSVRLWSPSVWQPLIRSSVRCRCARIMIF